MTINEYRTDLNTHSAEIFGMKWNFLEDDLVRIIDNNDIHEFRFKSFIDLKNSLQLSKSFQEKEITGLLVTKDEKLPHVMILQLDVRPKEKREITEGGIQAKMKYI